MVVTKRASTSPSGVMQERVARPLISTVQDPHRPIPQPYLVPVRPVSSRMAHNSGVSSAAFRVMGRPLSLKDVGMTLLRLRGDARTLALNTLFEILPGRAIGMGGAQETEQRG